MKPVERYEQITRQLTERGLDQRSQNSWWQTPNTLLDGETPSWVFKTGDWDAVMGAANQATGLQ